MLLVIVIVILISIVHICLSSSTSHFISTIAVSASDPILPAHHRPARLLASTYYNMTREELVDRLWIVEDLNHLLRLLNSTSMNLLAVLRERGTLDGFWERSVLEVGRNGVSGAEEEEEEDMEDTVYFAPLAPHRLLTAAMTFQFHLLHFSVAPLDQICV